VALKVRDAPALPLALIEGVRVAVDQAVAGPGLGEGQAEPRQVGVKEAVMFSNVVTSSVVVDRTVTEKYTGRKAVKGIVTDDPNVLKGQIEDGLTLSFPAKHENAASLVGQPDPTASNESTPSGAAALRRETLWVHVVTVSVPGCALAYQKYACGLL
jgi:hypothetical protein